MGVSLAVVLTLGALASLLVGNFVHNDIRGLGQDAGRELALNGTGGTRMLLQFNGNDVRARYNLAWCHQRGRDFPAALQVLAEALALDKTGEYRDRLVRTPDGWRIRHRVMRITHETGTRAILKPA